ncbi:hypothetical protein [Paraglaciecola sp.]|uniref:hypothetical protein n=1 Tax=Paraglaciecola sp. TaxID=1920173 RepID=UPI0030F44696
MIANWLVAKALHDVTEQEQIICQNKIQAKVHRLRLKYRTKTLLRRHDALGVVFLGGCLYGYVGKKRSTSNNVTSFISIALSLLQSK